MVLPRNIKYHLNFIHFFIKKWSKTTCVLFGFKLTDNASLNERLEAVKKIFEGSNENKDFCPDYVISNDKSELEGKSHPCKIYDDELNCISECDTVENMAEEIESCALEKLRLHMSNR